MTKSFIEVQFPVSRLSKESQSERSSNDGQTLTALGKWWGRKPLVLVRAAVLGLLMPASNDARRDREIFLKLMTMDGDGLRRRRSKAMTQSQIFDVLDKPGREASFNVENGKPRWKPGYSKGDKAAITDRAFALLSYDDQLKYCDGPEHLDGPSPEAWRDINAHLGTHAASLPDLVRELGERRFGHVPRVGDAFCGGGSIPFEAARIGCEVYASDLNPIAALLTWASLNIIGGGPEIAERVRQVQQRVFDAVDRQVTEWGIEHDTEGRRADAFLYCAEVTCPECGWKVPFAPGWVVGDKSRSVALLVPDERRRSFDIRVEQDADEAAMKKAKDSGTAVDGLRCPSPVCNGRTVSMQMLRGDRRVNGATVYGLRLWQDSDLVPRPEDVFRERLYCIRWVEKGGRRFFAAANSSDREREGRALELLRERLQEWQRKGLIPSAKIEPGYNTDQPTRERGWTYWHHLFTPRQLLLNGLLLERTLALATDPPELAGCLLAVARCCDWGSKLCRWGTGQARESIAQTFYDQALNPLITFASKGLSLLESNWMSRIPLSAPAPRGKVELAACHDVHRECDFWITDPPYGDAVRYEEITEFFLAWIGRHASRVLEAPAEDSRRALAIQGDATFKTSAALAYGHLAALTPPNGLHLVMFTHQDASVWADLALTLWAAGLQVSAAWCISTERENKIKEGNYVQGTVLLVLRKQTGEDTAFLDDLHPQVEDEVRHQLDSMLSLDDKEEPNFGDADLQLAAYAAALRVLTRYKRIEDLDVAAELRKVRARGERGPVVAIIEQAVRVSTDFLVPRGFDTNVWKRLAPDERLYLKGLELEAAGEQRTGVYQELARGFGVEDYKALLASGQANATRLKTATEFASGELGDGRFGRSLVRAALFAIFETVRSEETAGARQWLRNEYREFWDRRMQLVAVLDYLAALGHRLPHWQKDAHAANLLAGAVRNESV